MRLVLGFVQACYQRGPTMAAETEQARVKVFSVFQCLKSSVVVAGGNNHPDTGPLFQRGFKYNI